MRRALTLLETSPFPMLLVSLVGIVLLSVFAPSIVVGDTWLTLMAGREVTDHGLPHVDHITGVGRIKDEYSAPVYLHKDDLFLYEGAVQQGAMFGFKVRQPPPVDTYYDGTPITFGDYIVQVQTSLPNIVTGQASFKVVCTP